MSDRSEKGPGAAEIRIGIGSALAIILTVMGTFGAGFGVLHTEISSRFSSFRSEMAVLRSDMREDHAAMRNDIAGLRVDVGRLEVSVGRLEVRMGHVEQRLGRVEGGLGIQPPDDPAEIP